MIMFDALRSVFSSIPWEVPYSYWFSDTVCVVCLHIVKKKANKLFAKTYWRRPLKEWQPFRGKAFQDRKSWPYIVHKIVKSIQIKMISENVTVWGAQITWMKSCFNPLPLWGWGLHDALVPRKWMCGQDVVPVYTKKTHKYLWIKFWYYIMTNQQIFEWKRYRYLHSKQRQHHLQVIPSTPSFPSFWSVKYLQHWACTCTHHGHKCHGNISLAIISLKSSFSEKE